MNERELFRANRVNPNTMQPYPPRTATRHFAPMPVTERPLPRKACPGPRCLTLIAVTAHLCAFCTRSKMLDPLAFREAMARRAATLT